MAEIINTTILKRVFLVPLFLIFLASCSMGTHLKPTQVKSFKGVVIPELSSEPILIETVSKQLISRVDQKAKSLMKSAAHVTVKLEFSPVTYLTDFYDPEVTDE